MLLSPGHSPRLISSPSPSPSDLSLEAPESHLLHQNPTRKQTSVLDEDAYVAAIEKIIERDFFPDIPKLRDRLDWLEAVRSGDPVQIRDVQLKIIERRGSTNRENGVLKTLTPVSALFRSPTPSGSDKTPSVAPEIDGSDAIRPESDTIGDDLTLDEFFRRYTSQDNDSFSRILERVNKKKKEKYAYLMEREKADDVLMDDCSRDRITDGYGTSDQPPSTLESWAYTAKNLLMYHPSDRGEVPLTEEEKAVRLKGLTKEVNHTGTRFHGDFVGLKPKGVDMAAVLYSPVAGSTPIPSLIADRGGDRFKKYDLEELRRAPNQFYVESDKKAENGYSFVKTPSPMPGVDESPFITWGEIEGTPLRLDHFGTGDGDGPHFRIPYPPSRDTKAHYLSREAARRLKERSKMFKKPPLPSPMRLGSASPSGRTLSPAAQKFVRDAMAKASSSFDETLRASYGGTKSGNGTPKSARSMSRFARDGSTATTSSSLKEDSTIPW